MTRASSSRWRKRHEGPRSSSDACARRWRSLAGTRRGRRALVATPRPAPRAVGSSPSHDRTRRAGSDSCLARCLPVLGDAFARSPMSKCWSCSTWVELVHERRLDLRRRPPLPRTAICLVVEARSMADRAAGSSSSFAVADGGRRSPSARPTAAERGRPRARGARVSLVADLPRRRGAARRRLRSSTPIGSGTRGPPQSSRIARAGRHRRDPYLRARSRSPARGHRTPPLRRRVGPRLRTPRCPVARRSSPPNRRRARSCRPGTAGRPWTGPRARPAGSASDRPVRCAVIADEEGRGSGRRRWSGRRARRRSGTPGAAASTAIARPGGEVYRATSCSTGTRNRCRSTRSGRRDHAHRLRLRPRVSRTRLRHGGRWGGVGWGSGVWPRRTTTASSGGQMATIWPS